MSILLANIIKLNRIPFYLLITLLFFSLGGCPFISKPPVDPEPDLPTRAKQLAAQGQYQEAAYIYVQLAKQNPQPAKQGYQLIAVESFLKAGLLNEAKRELAQIDFTQGFNLEIPHKLVLARIDLAENHPIQARNQLTGIENPDTLPIDRRVNYVELWAQTLAETGNLAEAVKEYIVLDELLAQTGEFNNTVRDQKALWKNLNLVSESELRQLYQTTDEVLAGWVALALMKRTVDSRHLKKSVENWQVRYPKHPASQAIIASLLKGTSSTSSYVREIALLLPLSGNFKAQAEAVRDGFLAAWYHAQQTHGQQSVNVTVHEADAGNILQVYETVIQSGVDFVVGPLEKDALDKLASYYAQLPVPTLGLNYLKTASIRSGNLYQFSLSPEDEARAVAEQAWADGHRTAIVLIPEAAGDWGERHLNAFQTLWTNQGGKMIKAEVYNADPQPAVKALLTLNEPVDMAFVVAFPQLARQIRPLINQYYTGGDLPIYSTSHVYTGVPIPREDQHLNGIRFLDMPWILAPDATAKKLQTVLQKYWRDSVVHHKRLYAFGIDAFQILPHLAKLSKQQWQGQTGLLSIDSRGAIHRRLIWSQFVDGVPLVLR